jgi:cytochrome c oxidase subunit 2
MNDGGEVRLRSGSSPVDPTHVFSNAFGIETTIAAIVFGAICLAVLVAMGLSRHRRRSGRPPSKRSKNTPLELTYAAVVAAVVGFIVFVSFRATAQEHSPAPANGVRVDVRGFQWCWSFRYPTHGVQVTGTCQHGERPTMVVPVGEPVTINVSSDDVIHSWWVPHLRYKVDAFPNHPNTFTVSVDHAGRWIGRCAEFCGPSHYSMDFYLKAVSPARYRSWLAGAQHT